MAQLTLNQLGWGYISIFIVWNVALAVGVTFLWTHRGMPSVRMRKVPLLLAGIIPLHIFGSLCTTAYPFGAVAFKCVFEFWYVNNSSPNHTMMKCNTDFAKVHGEHLPLNTV
jgi:hypothetical protein